jgi:competence protein ComGC
MVWRVKKRFNSQSAQSIVEYVVVLALIVILVVTVIKGVGKSSQAKIAQANEGFGESAVANGTSGGGSPGTGLTKVHH